jgi:hypothetical protein
LYNSVLWVAKLCIIIVFFRKLTRLRTTNLSSKNFCQKKLVKLTLGFGHHCRSVSQSARETSVVNGNVPHSHHGRNFQQSHNFKNLDHFYAYEIIFLLQKRLDFWNINRLLMNWTSGRVPPCDRRAWLRQSLELHEKSSNATEISWIDSFAVPGIFSSILTTTKVQDFRFKVLSAIAFVWWIQATPLNE